MADVAHGGRRTNEPKKDFRPFLLIHDACPCFRRRSGGRRDVSLSFTVSGRSTLAYGPAVNPIGRTALGHQENSKTSELNVIGELYRSEKRNINPLLMQESCGEGGIRTLGTGVSPYNGLAILSAGTMPSNPSYLQSHPGTKTHLM